MMITYPSAAGEVRMLPRPKIKSKRLLCDSRRAVFEVFSGDLVVPVAELLGLALTCDKDQRPGAPLAEVWFRRRARRPTPGHAARCIPTSMGMKPRIFSMSFASVYPLYVQKATKKGRTKEEVDQVITWLTGYSDEQLRKTIDAKLDFETFFDQAPQLNPNVKLITGVVCGVRVEDVADPLMQKIRYLDKLIDELARGKQLQSILRQ
jgi:hypothetical protein